MQHETFTSMLLVTGIMCGASLKEIELGENSRDEFASSKGFNLPRQFVVVDLSGLGFDNPVQL